MAFSSPESAAGIVIGPLRQKGVEIDESLVLRLFTEIDSRQRASIHLDISGLYEKVIAALSWDACGPEGIRPIMLVSDNPSYRLRLRDDLAKIASVLQVTEILPSITYPVIRERDSAYICLNRYNNAVTNGGIAPLATEPALSLTEFSLPPTVAHKVCVKNCAAKSCALSSVCCYAKHINALRNGFFKLQIYPRRQYLLGLDSGDIPKRSVIIGAPPQTLNLARQYVSHVLSERDFSDYAYLSVYHCDKSAAKKERMAKHAKRFKKLSKFLFDKLYDNRRDSPNLSKWIAGLLECAEAIKRESKFTLTKAPKWARLHSRISGAMSDILTADKPFSNVVINREKRMATISILEPHRADRATRIS